MATRQIVYLFISCVVIGVIISAVSAGVHKEKYIIHVPIKYHTIHHIEVQKVPIYKKKHIHHHKHVEEEPQHEELLHGYDRYDDFSDESHKGAYGSYENSEEYD